MEYLPTTICLGSCQHPELAWALRDVPLEQASTFESACELIANASPGATVILCQAKPGDLPRNAADLLRAVQPQVELVSLLGSWLEGELRTGAPWPNVPRVYWYEFRRWWRQRGVQPLAPPRGVLVAADDYDTGAALVEALAAEGHSTVWVRDTGVLPVIGGLQAGVWVGGQLSGFAAQRLWKFHQLLRTHHAKTIALLDFPRLDEVAACERIGVSAVLGKPWDAALLSQEIRQRSWRAAVRELALA